MCLTCVRWALVAVLCVPAILLAQVTVGGNTPPPSGVELEIRSADKGFLPPRLNTLQRQSIISPQAGLLVFDTDMKALMIFNGTSWNAVMGQTDFGNSIRDTGTGQYGVNFDLDLDVAAVIFAQGTDIYKRVTNNNSTEWQKTAQLLTTGSAVAVYDNFVLIGQPYSNTVLSYQYYNGTWVKNDQIDAKTVPITSGDDFGYSVALTDSFAIVGAPGYQSGTGRAFVFRKVYDAKSPTYVSWQYIHSLLPNNTIGLTMREFGHSVDIDQNLCVIGAWKSGTNLYPNNGFAYLFNTNGLLLARLAASDTLRDAFFGSSVSVNGKYVAVGAQGKDGSNGSINMQGAAYIFEQSYTGSWRQVSKLLAPDSAANDQFGNSISIFEDHVVVGAFTKAINGNSSQGAAYVFQNKYGRWSFSTKLNDPTGAINGKFGSCVRIFGATILIGAPGKRSNKGDVYFLE